MILYFEFRSCLVVEFLDHNFIFSRYTYKKGKRKGKQGYILSDNDLQTSINDLWHSYLMCEGVRDVGSIFYILKYITKEMYLSDNYSTVSHLWLYQKQSYSCSNEFFDDTVCRYDLQLDTIKHNSNSKDNKFWNCSYLCSFNTPFPVDEWFFVVKDPPDNVKWRPTCDVDEVFREFFLDFYKNRLCCDESNS